MATKATRAGVALAALLACNAGNPGAPAPREEAGPPPVVIPARLDLSKRPPPPRLENRIAYIPPQCFAKTRDAAGSTHNSCYVCHTKAVIPNYTSDDDLQVRLSFPPLARDNPWKNLVDPPYLHAPRASDEDTLAYVRQSNYFDKAGAIALARAMDALPPDWDGNGNGAWDGYRPDAWLAFDDRGFDHRPDGSLSGWRAFAYYPLPGAFLPANGSFDDVLIRLPEALREDDRGTPDTGIYTVNLAIVESLIRRTDIVIDPVDEGALGVDLDLDGRLGRATRITFDDGTATRMHYVGRGRAEEASGKLPILPGMFPLGTELFHTVRYLDVGPDGVPRMSARMKEVRYAKKVRWESYPVAHAHAVRDARDTEESPDGTHLVHWQKEIGTFSDHGWMLQGFIEAADGSLRPQTYDEMAYCAGCHGGIGATTDSTFSFARKVAAGPARGWFHWTQRDLRGLPEPRRHDGRYEYETYLSTALEGGDLEANPEITARFFDPRSLPTPALRTDELARLRDDVSRLLLPSARRALDLDRAYRAIVVSQSFARGREVVLTPNSQVYARVPLGEPTGVSLATTAD